MSNNSKTIVLFDGVCNLCTNSVQFIIKYDLRDNIRLVAMQTPLGKKLVKKYLIDIDKNSSIVSIYNEKIQYRSRAVFFILSQLQTSWKILLIFSFLPTIFTDFLYRFIAKNRYRFFGKRKKCLMPSDSINSKFLS